MTGKTDDSRETDASGDPAVSPKIPGNARALHARVQAAITALAGGPATYDGEEWLYPEEWFTRPGCESDDYVRLDRITADLLRWLDLRFPNGAP